MSDVVSYVITHVGGAAAPPDGPYDLDIVILALDRVEDTAAAIGSALAQTGVVRHVTILDQGSSPANLAHLSTVIDGRSDATLLRAATNLGVGGGRNAATAFGHGTAIAALDNDAEFATPTTAAAAAEVLRDDPSLAAIGLRIVLFDGGADDRSSWGYPPSLAAQAGERFDAVTFVGAGHAIRRAAWEEAGGYDAALFFCWEEFDFCLRALDRGWRVRYCGDLVIRHKVAAERRVNWSGDRWFHYVRNRLVIERRWGASWLSLVPRIAGYAIKGGRHGLVRDTAQAIAAAHRMRAPTRRLSADARTYLTQNDRAHRGSVVHRLRSEVLALLPGAAHGSSRG